MFQYIESLAKGYSDKHGFCVRSDQSLSYN